jgi:hypothetical protein
MMAWHVGNGIDSFLCVAPSHPMASAADDAMDIAMKAHKRSRDEAFQGADNESAETHPPDAEGSKAHPAAKRQRNCLTEEQKAIVSVELSRHTQLQYVEIQAYSGTGKSFCLREWAAAHPKQRLGIPIFNRPMADSANASAAERGIENIVSNSWHQLAFSFIVGKKKMGYRVSSQPADETRDSAAAADMGENALIDLGFKHAMADWYVETAEEANARPDAAVPLAYPPTPEDESEEKTFWSFVLSTLRTFCKSDHLKITRDDAYQLHQAYERRDAARESGSKRARDRWLPDTDIVVVVCQRIMDAILRKDLLDINLDIALKLMHLLNIKLDKWCDVLSPDEAQDLNYVMLAIVRNQKGVCPIMAVGDEHQAVNQWNHTCDATRLLRADYPLKGQRKLLRLTETFRFSTSVCTIINRLFDAFAPLARPLVSNVKHTTTIYPLPTMDDLMRSIFEDVNAEVQSRSCASGGPAVALICRTKAEAVLLLEEFLAYITDDYYLDQDVTKMQVTYTCSSSISSALKTTLKLARMNDAQLQVAMQRAEEEDDRERCDIIWSLLQNPRRKQFAINLQRVMTMERAADQASVSLTTGHVAKGLEFYAVYVMEGMDKALEKLQQAKQTYLDEVRCATLAQERCREMDAELNTLVSSSECLSGRATPTRNESSVAVDTTDMDAVMVPAIACATEIDGHHSAAAAAAAATATASSRDNLLVDAAGESNEISVVHEFEPPRPLLNLVYVSISRPKQKLYLPPELFDFLVTQPELAASKSAQQAAAASSSNCRA